jgi:PhoH-like ATPase
LERRKIFVLDTSVLLYDMHAIHSFPDNTVVIPYIVLDEIDRFKDRPDYVGACARYVNRFLDELRIHGDLTKGIYVNYLENVDHEQIIKVDLEQRSAPDLPDGLSDTGDNKIISSALWAKANNKEQEVILISKDINLRVKCDSLGIKAEDYLADHVEIPKDKIYTGNIELELTSEEIDEFYVNGKLKFTVEHDEILPNCFVVGKNPEGDKSLIGRYVNNHIFPIRYKMNEIVNAQPRNKEQKFALELLQDKDIELISISGIAGSGKTYLTLVSAVSQLWNKEIEQIVITRSIQPVGKEMGHLPGDLMDKMDPWLSPILDNFRHAFKDRDRGYFNQLIDSGKIEVAPLAYMRGRTFNDALVIVDEAQNATIHELKTIITRIGKNSRVVLLGDIDQVDTPYINSQSNGLTIVIEKLKKSELTGHITLVKGQRSAVASLASELL